MEKNDIYFIIAVSIGVIPIIAAAMTDSVMATYIFLIVTIFIFAVYTVFWWINSKKAKTKIDELQREVLGNKNYETIIETMLPAVQQRAKDTFKNFQDLFQNHKEGFSGGLTKSDYYKTLYNSIDKTKDHYDNIWACSTLKDFEWNPNDENEEKLMNKFKAADKKGVRTIRLYIFENSEILRPSKISDVEFGDISKFLDCLDSLNSDKELEKFNRFDTLSTIISGKTKDEIQRTISCLKSFSKIKSLIPYLKNTEYKNTKSFVVRPNFFKDLHSDEKKLLGEGFCAFEFSDKSKCFTYDVPRHKFKDRALGLGEIVYNEQEIKKIKKVFDKCVQENVELEDYIFAKDSNNVYVNITNDAAEFLKVNGVTIK